MNTIVRFVPYAVIALGLFFITIGVVDLAGTLKFRLSANTAMAEIIRIDVEKVQAEEDHRTIDTYRPVVQYTDAGGTVRQATSPIASQQYAFDPGDEVQIYYDPHAPGDIRIAGFISSFLFPLVLTIMGLFTIAMASVARWAIRGDKPG